jgi:hypothetical protein
LLGVSLEPGMDWKQTGVETNCTGKKLDWKQTGLETTKN